MGKEHVEQPENNASTLIRDDYLNEYSTTLRLVGEGTIRPLSPKSFSERYPNMTFGGIPFSVSEQEKVVIEELDRLSAEANRLLAEPTLDKKALLAVAIQAAETCNRHDIAEKFKEGLKE